MPWIFLLLTFTGFDLWVLTTSNGSDLLSANADRVNFCPCSFAGNKRINLSGLGFNSPGSGDGQHAPPVIPGWRRGRLCLRRGVLSFSRSWGAIPTSFDSWKMFGRLLQVNFPTGHFHLHSCPSLDDATRCSGSSNWIKKIQKLPNSACLTCPAHHHAQLCIFRPSALIQTLPCLVHVF